MNIRCSIVLILLLFAAGCSQPQPRQVLNYKVEIEVWSMFSRSIITVKNGTVEMILDASADSLSEGKRITHTLDAACRPEILASLGSPDLDTLQENYVNHNSMDDALEFVFRFTIDGKNKVTHIYMTRVEPVFRFVAAVNKGLPADAQIPYTAHYFEHGD